ncbi:hypothetical protein H5410_062893 [Solanum commersonii]|uniref:Uncharacterized protein n=1 Tax=Solanum commersonii TaxID=4109 RepID=A0A9J5WCT3_SOLCO|nr:hypothetical protein H5410_062893 [Solanum commersonii]
MLSKFSIKGDVWALYMHWSPKRNEITLYNMIHNYDMVEDTQPNHNMAFQAQKFIRGYGGSINEGAAFPLELPLYLWVDAFLTVTFLVNRFLQRFSRGSYYEWELELTSLLCGNFHAFRCHSHWCKRIQPDTELSPNVPNSKTSTYRSEHAAQDQ